MPSAVRIRGCFAGLTAGFIVGLLVAAALSVVTEEGSISRGALVSVAVLVLPMTLAVLAYRRPPRVERRTRNRVLMAGGGIVVVGMAGFIILAGLIPVGLAVVLIALLLPTRSAIAAEHAAPQ